MKFEEKY